MTRWKREPIYTLRLMHDHNRLSRWHEYVLDAADKLGLPVGYRTYANHWDGSTDREWYTLASALERVGGIEAVHEKANALRDEHEAKLNPDYYDLGTDGLTYVPTDAAW